jgi:hypothetical protein
MNRTGTNFEVIFKSATESTETGSVHMGGGGEQASKFLPKPLFNIKFKYTDGESKNI